MLEKQENKIKLETKYHFIGWILFVICAVFFIAASLKDKEVLTLIGSIIFLIACIVFLIPLVKQKTSEGPYKNVISKNQTKMFQLTQ